MKRFHFNPIIKIALLFIPAVILPGLILSFLAIRTLSREEIIFERQLETTLQEELSRTIAQINSEINLMKQELSQSVDSFGMPNNYKSWLPNWGNKNNAVKQPFVISSDYKILYPQVQSALSDQALTFLVRNKEFLTNQIEIPWYQNIAKLYQRKLLENNENNSSQRAFVKPVFLEPKKVEIQTQQAVTQLENNSQIREEIYQDLDQRGAQVSNRFILPKSVSKRKTDESKPINKSTFADDEMNDLSRPILRVKSILVANERSLQSITKGKNSGLIPRIQNDQLNIIYWKKLEGDIIVGSLIDMTYFKNRIRQLIPVINNGIRIINLMDEYGTSLLEAHADIMRTSWLSPFISREISETVPGWELAVNLSDDQYIQTRVEQKRLFLLLLVLILMVAMFFGGGLIYYTTVLQVRAASMKSNFVANVSHELKTPLTSIRMYAEMLNDGRVKNPQRRKRYLSTIVNETERLTRLINNVLDFSRLDRGKKHYDFQRLELNQFCYELIETQRLMMEQNGFIIKCHQASKALFVNADEESLRQVLINLFSNAEKYCCEKKQVEVQLKVDERDAIIIVSDWGIGIPVKQRETVFKEFYRVDDSLTAQVNGSGLGLSISRQLIEDHHGTIACQIANHPGTDIMIKLPLIKSEA